MRERLEKELAEAAPQAAKVKVMLPVNATERRYSVWIGESIEFNKVVTNHAFLRSLALTTSQTP